MDLKLARISPSSSRHVDSNKRWSYSSQRRWGGEKVLGVIWDPKADSVKAAKIRLRLLGIKRLDWSDMVDIDKKSGGNSDFSPWNK